MKFCEKCQSLLKPRGENLVCDDCGYSYKGNLKTKDATINLDERKGVEIVSDKNPLAEYPSTCKKCGYDKAEIILREPMISDEDTIVMMKCGKCGKVENQTKKMG